MVNPYPHVGGAGGSGVGNCGGAGIGAMGSSGIRPGLGGTSSGLGGGIGLSGGLFGWFSPALADILIFSHDVYYF
jgi:hypothetical protein